jgi:hypothetical protein
MSEHMTKPVKHKDDEISDEAIEAMVAEAVKVEMTYLFQLESLLARRYYRMRRFQAMAAPGLLIKNAELMTEQAFIQYHNFREKHDNHTIA